VPTAGFEENTESPDISATEAERQFQNARRWLRRELRDDQDEG
jgi:hypothetical protein